MPGTTTRQPTPRGRRPLDVLVVDDNPGIRISFAIILRNAGYEVDEAENGAVALAVLSSTEVGAIVLDVRMPQLDGLQFLDAVTDPPPVLLVTSQLYDASVVARRSKIFAYARKPIPPEALLDLVARALGGEGRGDNVTEYQITCVGRTTVPGGHRHITSVGTDFGRRDWDICRLVDRLALGDRFFLRIPGGSRTFAFAKRCDCNFESIRTIEGEYQSVDHLDSSPLCYEVASAR